MYGSFCKLGVQKIIVYSWFITVLAASMAEAQTTFPSSACPKNCALETEVESSLLTMF